MATLKYPGSQAAVWVGGEQPRKRHLLDCDYFSSPGKLRRATLKERDLPVCQWCITRMQRSMGGAA
jgi:hypothetical protein